MTVIRTSATSDCSSFSVPKAMTWKSLCVVKGEKVLDDLYKEELKYGDTIHLRQSRMNESFLYPLT